MSNEHPRFADVWVDVADFRNVVNIWWMGPRQPDRRQSLALPTWRWHDFRGDEMIPPGVGPSVRLDHREAKALMSALWQAGVRPDVHDRDPNAQINAMTNHLEDMRRLVFDGAYVATTKGTR